MAESISFNITAESAQAQRSFRDTGRAALDASGKIDIASVSLKTFEEVQAKAAKADATSVAAVKAHTRALGLLSDAEAVLEGRATRTTRLFADQHRQLSLLATAAEDAAGAAGGGGGGILATIAGAGGAPGGIAGVAAGLAALPFAAQAASGGIVSILGGGLTALGVLSAAKAKRVRADWKGLFGQAGTDLRQVVQPFVGVLKEISKVGQSVLPSIMLGLVAPMKILAPAFQAVSDSVLRSFASPAVSASIKAVAAAFGGLLKALAPQLPGDIADVATGITRVANSFARGAPQFAAVISFFFKATGFALSMVSALTNVAVYVEKHLIPAMNDIRKVWDQVRHDTASAWDQIYSDTIGAVIRIVKGVNSWFGKLPGEVLASLRGLGHSLGSFASAALNEMWDGFKHVAGGILGWFSHFGSDIIGVVKKVLGIFSPSSVFFGIGVNLMEGLRLGVEHGTSKAVAAAHAAAGKIPSGLGGNVTSWINTSLAINRLPSWWAPLMAILVSKESGGNPRAYNPISVLGQHAEGIAQMLPSTFANWSRGGSIWNPVANLVASERYISNLYGNPRNIPGLLGGTYRGYALGGMITEPVLGVGLRTGGRYGFGERGPEMVTPVRGGAPATVVVEIASSGNEFDAFLLRWLQKNARIRGGGNVQTAFGRG